jgi:hypothetical protein
MHLERRQRTVARLLLAVAIALAATTSVGVARAASSSPFVTPSVAPSFSSRAVVFVGSSVEGRRIETTCRGDGDQLVVLVGGIHTGGEMVTVALAEEMAAALRSGELLVPPNVFLCVLPLLNPDGAANGSRTNARDVDLNRNWPSDNWMSEAQHTAYELVSGGETPLSEPETMSLWSYLTAARPTVVIVWHCCGGLVEANEAGNAGPLAEWYAAGADLVYTEEWTTYPVTGQFIDAMEHVGFAAMDVEIKSSDDSAFASHRSGVEAVLRQLAITTH